ncbi:cell division protein FtsX [Hamadaea flava]|uniref:Permease-like cell division protein FtsX n=1 Tax=Hamadaea flava TaxID=1742688 RepID=A0ABV8LHV8_9ACTN|nr:permease-like cell division protein FtsX [Hamadaea flava]MCP2324351.1 cell division protein FtsX [Hamadaea flava]
MSDVLDPVADEPAPSPQGPVHRRRWLLPVCVAVAFLVGVVGATGTLALTGRLATNHRFTVLVFLDPDITADQQAAIESALSKLDGVDSVKFESSEDAQRKMLDGLKGDPALAQQASTVTMPATFQADFHERTFDCGRLTPVAHLPGIKQVSVHQRPTADRPGATLACGNLL